MRRTKLIFFLVCVFMMFCSSICFADEEYSGDKKHQVIIPRLLEDSYEYNGSEIKAEFRFLDSQYEYIKAEGIKQTKPGNYEAKISLIDSETSEWTDGKTEDKIYKWNIKKATARLYNHIDKYEYKNSEIELNLADILWTHLDNDMLDDFFELSGEYKETEIGAYRAVVSIKDSAKEYVTWEDGTTEPATFTWEIEKAIVTIPKVTGLYVYNGEEQELKFSAFPPFFDYNLVNIAGNKATNAGKYQVTISLKNAEYSEWEDGTVEDITYEWEIEKRSIDLPGPLKTKYDYDGKEKEISISFRGNKLDVKDGVIITGDVTATEVGEYKVKVSLKENYRWYYEYYSSSLYKWADGTSEDLIIEWEIVNSDTATNDDTDVIKYSIKASSGKHGSISPSGKVEVNEGDNQIFRFTADDGYEIEDVIVDGKSVGVASKYTFSNVQKNHTIDVTFKEIEEKDTYIIEPECGKHGTISPNKNVEVEKGENVKFTFKPDSGYEIEDVIVDGKSVGVVSKYEFENIKKNHTIEVTFSKIIEEPNNTYGNQEENKEYKNPFNDIKEKDWYYSAVSFANQKGLFKGVNDTEFGANVTMNRGMIVTVLHRLAKEEKANNITTFNDVKANDYYSNAVNWAVEKGITNGTGNGKFEPSSSVTREQLVVMIYRYAKMSGKDVNKKANLLNYEDNNRIDDYAKEAFEWAIEEKIITGRTETELAPKGTATRAEVATILMRFIQNVK